MSTSSAWFKSLQCYRFKFTHFFGVATGNRTAAESHRRQCSQCQGWNGETVSPSWIPASSCQAPHKLHKDSYKAEYGGTKLRICKSNAWPPALQGTSEQAGWAQKPYWYVRSEGPNQQIHWSLGRPFTVLCRHPESPINHWPWCLWPLRRKILCPLHTWLYHLWYGKHQKVRCSCRPCTLTFWLICYLVCVMYKAIRVSNCVVCIFLWLEILV